MYSSDISSRINSSAVEGKDYSNHMFHQNASERRLDSLSPRLTHPGIISNKHSSTKVSRDSGCFDDSSLTTLTINESSFPTRTSPTASDRSSHSAGLASHTDESGIHNMNEDCFFEEEENERSSSSGNKEKEVLRSRNISTDSKQKSVFLQHSEASKSPVVPCSRYSKTESIPPNPEGKYPSLVGKYGRGMSSSQSERISESRFNSVRNIFEQKGNTNLSIAGMSENKKT